MNEAQKEAERQAEFEYPMMTEDEFYKTSMDDTTYNYYTGEVILNRAAYCQSFLSGYEFREQKEWVDVKERLPEESGYYPCIDIEMRGWQKRYFNAVSKEWESAGVNVTKYVTHFLELPTITTK